MSERVYIERLTKERDELAQELAGANLAAEGLEKLLGRAIQERDEARVKHFQSLLAEPEKASDEVSVLRQSNERASALIGELEAEKSRIWESNARLDVELSRLRQVASATIGERDKLIDELAEAKRNGNELAILQRDEAIAERKLAISQWSDSQLELAELRFKLEARDVTVGALGAALGEAMDQLDDLQPDDEEPRVTQPTDAEAERLSLLELVAAMARRLMETR